MCTSWFLCYCPDSRKVFITSVRIADHAGGACAPEAHGKRMLALLTTLGIMSVCSGLTSYFSIPLLVCSSERRKSEIVIRGWEESSYHSLLLLVGAVSQNMEATQQTGERHTTSHPYHSFLFHLSYKKRKEFWFLWLSICTLLCMKHNVVFNLPCVVKHF